MQQTTLPLVIAALAVFFGPLITLCIANRQMKSAERIAQQNLIGPIRQAWITDLRKRLAEVTALSLHYFQAGYEDREDTEYQHLTLLGQEINLMLSPDMDVEHRQLLKAIGDMHAALRRGPDRTQEFIDAYEKTLDLARNVLRAEWQRVKHNV